MDLLHSFGTASPIAIVKVHLLALKDECTQAILLNCQHTSLLKIMHQVFRATYLAGCDGAQCFDCHLALVAPNIFAISNDVPEGRCRGEWRHYKNPSSDLGMTKSGLAPKRASAGKTPVR